jgi:hypothetical protein
VLNSRGCLPRDDCLLYDRQSDDWVVASYNIEQGGMPRLEYKYIPTAKTWECAELCCQTIGGHLASIHNEDNNKLVQKLGFSKNARAVFASLNDYTNPNSYAGRIKIYQDDALPTLWLGLNDREKQGKFKWAGESEEASLNALIPPFINIKHTKRRPGSKVGHEVGI